MKTGLVLEGGAMRGMFTAGVLDVWMEQGLSFDGIIGVSAGALFGCNYKSHQPGRVLRYTKRFCRDPRYCSVRSLIKTGDLYNADFCYQVVPSRLDVFDSETFQKDPTEFYVTATDVVTGKAVYHRCETGTGDELLWFRASASMPLAAKPVEIDGLTLLDGGMADSVPLRKMEELGFDRNVVILTRPLGYVKEKNRALPLISLSLRQYPNMIKAIANRHEHYNETIRWIRERERRGEILVIRPENALPIGKTERDPAKLQAVYDLGRAAGEKRLAAVRAFLAKGEA